MSNQISNRLIIFGLMGIETRKRNISEYFVRKHKRHKRCACVIKDNEFSNLNY